MEQRDCDDRVERPAEKPAVPCNQVTATRPPAVVLRRLLFFAVVCASAVAGSVLMYRVLSANGLGMLEAAILVLFALTFLWIATAFWSAMAGAVLMMLGRDPLTLRRPGAAAPGPVSLSSRTAVVMPVHNENVSRVVAGLEATLGDLARSGASAAFDFFLLSDSTDSIIAGRERREVSKLMARMASARPAVHYRRRASNEGRKAGNIADFCRHWRGYDHMIVLDADSVMTGEALLQLVGAMQANPSAGIIQTVPLPIRSTTPFGRALQFAANLYSPMLACGLSFWQTTAANYWGHNAIIRMEPFIRHCKLPRLSGSPPLGGEILSHDFVEAALMRRAGWDVMLMPGIRGSYEEVPGNMFDYARRDRRWSEGNLQHLRLLNMPGLHPLSRLHFLMGAFAYGCSFLWLLMLSLSSIDAVSRATGTVHYFGSGRALFPDWPVFHAGEMWVLVGVVVTMLLLPKVAGVLLCLADPRRRRTFAGARGVCSSAAVELILSVLVAPVLMCFHAWFVATVLMGQRVRWDCQHRQGGQLGWGDAIRGTAVMTALGVCWGIVTYQATPIFFWALLPVLLGLVFAAPLVVLTSHRGLGLKLMRWRLFATPAEIEPDRVIEDLAAREPGTADVGPESPPADRGSPVERIREDVTILPSSTSGA